MVRCDILVPVASAENRLCAVSGRIQGDFAQDTAQTVFGPLSRGDGDIPDSTGRQRRMIRLSLLRFRNVKGLI